MYKKFTTNFSRPALFPRIILLAALLTAGWVSSNTSIAQTGPILRINAGTESEASGGGETFIGDTFFESNSSVVPSINSSVSNTNVEGVYQSERISNGSFETFGYNIPVENGTYTVTLHFAETAFGNEGQRQFNVEIEGVQVLTDYDIIEEAGGPNIAKEETIFNVSVSDGELTIDFDSVIERAKINGIEIAGDINPIAIPFALNAGGNEYTSGDTGLTWLEDDGNYFLNEGMPFVKTGDIGNTEDDDVYNAERFNPSLRFVLPGFEKGLYTIELHFVETNHQASGQRVFDVSIEGNTVLNNYDIFDEAGFSSAVVKEYVDTPILDGILDISLIASEGSATINGIAITGATSVSNESFDDAELPNSHRLTAAYPNPFNPQTQFALSVANTQQVEITVFNLLGQRVSSLFNGTMAAQQERLFSFDAASLPSGIYLIQVRGEQFLETQQVILLK